MQNNNKGIAHLLLIIIVTAVIGFWYLFSNYRASNSPEKTRFYVGNTKQCTLLEYGCPEGYKGFSDNKGCGCELTPLVEQSINTDNWKTYINEGFNFFVKHPDNWEVKEHVVNLDERNETQFILSKKESNSIGDSILFIPTSAETYKKPVGTGYDEFHGSGSFNGYPADIKVRGEHDTRPNDSIRIKSPSSDYHITIIFDYKLADNKDLIDQILSTFDLIESSESKLKVCPDGWYDVHSCMSENCSIGEHFLVEVNGELEQKDPSDYDLEWIRNNCKISSPADIG